MKLLERTPCLRIVVLIAIALIAQGTWAAKLTLTPSQVSLDGATSDGIPGRLVDEQALAGDPRAGDDIDVISNWASSSGNHVNAAIIDLGSVHRIDRIYLYDRNGSAGTGPPFTVSVGSAASGWGTPLISDALALYQVWRGFPNNTSNDGTGFVDDPALEFSGVTTRYLRVVNPSGLLGMPEIVIYGEPVGTGTGDVAAGKPATASSSYDATTPAANAVDSSTTTEWRSNGAAKPYTYLEIDLGGYYSISQLDLALGTPTGSAPAGFEIQAQNEGCWKTVPGTAVTGNPASNVNVSFPLSSTLITDKLRFVCYSGGSGCRVRNLAATGSPSSASAAPLPSCGAGTQVARRSPSYDYAQFLPSDYDNDPAETFPLVIALHGIKGETLDTTHTAVASSPEGLSKQLTSSTFRSTFPAIVVSPHCTAVNVAADTDCSFTRARLEELWRDVMSTYRIDADRIYITGLSAGAIASNEFALYHHQELAALLPIAGDLSRLTTKRSFDAAGEPVPDTDGRHICDMKQLPIFAAHGTNDGTVKPFRTTDFQKIMNLDCQPDHPKMLIRLLVGTGHNSWDATYGNQKTYEWLFAQRASNKALPSTHQAPVVTVSANQSVTLPTNSATFTGSATDADGTIAKFSWVDVSNVSSTWPTEVASSSSATATFSRTTAGTYKFRLIATDDDSFTGYATVTFTVQP
jgi:poly(3-hydroxybutyrate) depolymerase